MGFFRQYCFLLFFIIGFSHSFTATAQEIPIQFKRISTEDGLPRSSVKAITQDNQGYIWIGTDYGVSRFDGYEFTTYHYDPDDSTSMAGNLVGSFCLDSKGRLWLGANGGGVSIYSPETNSFTSFKHNPEDINTISSNFIYHIFEDSRKNIWISTKDGLNLLDPETLQVTRIPYEQGGVRSTKSKYIKQVFQDKEGDLWLISDAGLSKIVYESPHEIYFRNFPSDAPNALPSKFAKQMIQDSKGRLWIIADGGFSLFDKQREVFKNYVHEPNNSQSPSNKYIKSIAEAPDGNLWIGADKGISIFNPETERFRHLAHIPSNQYTLSNDYVKCIFKDNMGTMWVGTDAGLNVYDPYAKPFQLYTNQAYDKGSLSGNCIYSVIEDDATQITYVGSDNGLDQWDRTQNKLTHYLEGLSVKYLLKDSQGTLWAGTDSGLFSALLTSGKLQFRHYTHDPSNPFSLCDNSIVHLSEDKERRVWVSTFGNGICYFDKSTSRFISFSKPLISSNQVRFMIQTQDGKYWAGTGGVDIIEKGLNKSTLLVSKEILKKLFQQSAISTILEDSKGIIWLGTTESGLIKYEMEKDLVLAYTKDSGLPSNVIQGISEDKKGNFWVSTNKGVSYFDTNTEQFKNYNQTDGLQGDEFNYHAIYINKNNEVYLGGSNGLNILNPDFLKKNYTVPPVYITNIYSRQEFSQADSGLQNIWKPAHIPNELTFEPSTKDIKISFVALNYRNSLRNQYAYKLEPIQKGWEHVKAVQREAIFTNLAPGKYTFYVKASNNDGVWNEKSARISFTIKPNWWQRKPAKVMFPIIGLAILFSILRIRTRLLEKQKKELTKQVSSQTLTLEKQKNEVLKQNQDLQLLAEEVASQRDRLEQQHEILEGVFNDMKIVSDVGKQITSSLDINTIVETVYYHVNQLVNAPTFAIGVYNEQSEILEFTEIDPKTKESKHTHDSLNDISRLSVQCFLGTQEIIIHDIHSEKKTYGVSEQLLENEENQSIIYLPLLAKGQRVGVLTIQATQKNAYDERQIDILRTLSSYIGIALDNTHAYDVIKTKNNLITDSLKYAQTIQQAILPTEKQLSEAFQNYFVLYRPKDIVSGDFYWHMSIEENSATKHYLALVDCTGHGVPGAFMSLIGSRILNEVLLEKGIRQPDQILEMLNKSVRIALQQDQNDGIYANTDGMDIGLIMIQYSQNNSVDLSYTGAKIPLYYILDGELKRLSESRRSIGGYQWSTKPFETHQINLPKGSNCYLTTDGFLHQNAPNHKKFGRKRFVEILQENHHLPMKQQEELLLNAIEAHQDKEEQRDDITVLGIQL